MSTTPNSLSENAFLAIDLGGTKCAGALMHEGRLSVKQSVRIAGTGGEQVFDLITGLIRSLMADAADQKLSPGGVGLSVPGISQPDGTVWAPNIPDWDNFPLKDRLQEQFEVPIHIDSDRACAIRGESWSGAAKGLSDAIYVAVGTGIGAGIMIGGEVLQGAHRIAGAIGWLSLESNYRDGYETFGCFEYNASGDGLARIARDLLASGVATRIPSSAPSSADVLEYYDQGDELAQAVINNATSYWGRAVANLVSIFNPEAVVMGGGLFGPANRFIPRIAEEAARWAQPIAFRKCRILASVLGNDALLLGAIRPFEDADL